jgi:hypothetical protein
MKRRLLLLSLFFFLAGSLLRLLLCWGNPPNNSFDNHYEPIYLMISTGRIPAPGACWQCYQPPVFYGISALVGKLALTLGMKPPHVVKLLQFVVCFYGILTLVVLRGILNLLPLSDFSRLMAFGTACFLPRHIYMSAMHSNDTISYLFVSLSVYLVLLAIERKFPLWLLLITCVTITLTLFTKFTAFVILPVSWCVFVLAVYKKLFASRRRAVFACVMTVLIPSGALGMYVVSNLVSTGRALPWNVDQSDPSLIQPHDRERIDFYSFTPWDSISGPPMIVPGRMHSFWTLAYCGMWFDNEPKFLFMLDHHAWWDHYFAWLRGQERYPGDSYSLPALTKFTGTALLVLGLLPLFLMLCGLFQYGRAIWTRSVSVVETVKLSVFPVLLFMNAVGIIALALRLPVYSAAKASYFLNSMPAFAVFFSLGLMSLERWRGLKAVLLVLFSALFVLSAVHILQIVQAAL